MLLAGAVLAGCGSDGGAAGPAPAPSPPPVVTAPPLPSPSATAAEVTVTPAPTRTPRSTPRPARSPSPGSKVRSGVGAGVVRYVTAVNAHDVGALCAGFRPPTPAVCGGSLPPQPRLTGPELGQVAIVARPQITRRGARAQATVRLAAVQRGGELTETLTPAPQRRPLDRDAAKSVVLPVPRSAGPVTW